MRPPSRLATLGSTPPPLAVRSRGRKAMWRAGEERCRSLVEKRNRADFDALARARPCRRRRINKRRMRREARAPVLRRIVVLQQNHFVRLHLGNIKPAMARIEGRIVN